MITIKNLTKSFGSNEVLKHVNLDLSRGRVYGIVGRNGAGKTTLFRCIAGLENYDGEIESDYKELKNHIGLLETNPLFMSRITAWEYLKMLCVARGIKSDDFESQNIFDLPLNSYAENYSTGMKKKLALMAVILQKNDVFILDEPFNGVDIQSNILIVELINELRKSGKTIIISSHIFSSLSDTCDKIFLIENGSISKTVSRDDFKELELEMKDAFVGKRLSNLDLS